MNHTIIGHDINGRPLRVGDGVVLARVLNPLSRFKAGERLTIGGDLGLTQMITGPFEAFWPIEDAEYSCAYDSVHKLHNDHRPADESFTEMMDKLTSRHGQLLDTKKD